MVMKPETGKDGSVRAKASSRSSASGADRWCDIIRWSYEILRLRFANLRMTDAPLR